MSTNHPQEQQEATIRKAAIKRQNINADKDFVVRKESPDPQHLRALISIAKDNKPLDPVLLWEDVSSSAADTFVLLDGRYRLKAYDIAKWRRGIPAKIIRCTKREAMLLATVDAIKDRHNLTKAEKADRAWRLVRDAESVYSKAEIAKATGVGPATVGRMRKRWKELMQIDENERDVTGNWWRDRKNKDDDMNYNLDRYELTPKQCEAMIEELAEEIRNTLDWRKRKCLIAHTELKYEAILKAIGTQELRRFFEWHCGGDEDFIKNLQTQWEDEIADDDDFDF